MIFCEIFAAIPIINVYKSVSEITGFSKIIETHDKMWKMLKDLRDEIGDMEEVDAWDPETHNRPAYKGCEPLIFSYNPVRCENNF